MNLFRFSFKALVLAIIFAGIVIYSRCCQTSTISSRSGFQRYEPLVQDEHDSPVIGRMNGRKTLVPKHRSASDSDDDDNQTLFSSKRMIP